MTNTQDRTIVPVERCPNHAATFIRTDGKTGPIYCRQCAPNPTPIPADGEVERIMRIIADRKAVYATKAASRDLSAEDDMNPHERALFAIEVLEWLESALTQQPSPKASDPQPD